MSKISNNANTLLLITSNYPFGTREPYIETEVNILKNYFSKIIIISNDTNSTITQPIPNNIEVLRNSFDLNLFEKLISLRYLFSISFYRELQIIKKLYKQPLELVQVKTILVTMQTGLKVSKMIQQLMKKNKIIERNLFICSFWNSNMAYGISCFKRKYKHAIGVTRAHRWDIFFEGNKGNYLPMRRPIFDNLDSIFFSSMEGRSYFSKKLKIENKKLRIGWLGIKKSEFNAIKIKHSPLEILTCSAMISRKRNHLLIEALSEIDGLEIKWSHIGDGPEMESLLSLADKLLSPKKNIQYSFLGRYSNPELYSYYRDKPIDVFLNLSTSEGVPMAIVEIMSFCIPVIATNVGGVSEIVNNHNGVLLSANPSTEEIVNALKMISCLNDEEYSIYKQNAYETWSNRFDAEKTYSKFAMDLLALQKV